MKYLFAIINTLLIAASAYFCVEILYKTLGQAYTLSPDDPFAITISKNIRPQKQTKQIINIDQNKIILTRNLFNVEVDGKKGLLLKSETEDKEPENLEATTLKLILWGTVTGDSFFYAVIEDKSNRQQSLYQVGDSVQGAKVKRIFRNKVILFYQGKNQVLEMQTDDETPLKSKVSTKSKLAPRIPVEKNIAEQSTDIPDEIMKQIKFRPNFTEGEPDGLMVYGIRPNSVFRQIGMRNGDIIKDINGMPILSTEDVSEFFTEIEGAEKAKLIIFRRGKVQELFYEIKEGQYSVTDPPED